MTGRVAASTFKALSQPPTSPARCPAALGRRCQRSSALQQSDRSGWLPRRWGQSQQHPTQERPLPLQTRSRGPGPLIPSVGCEVRKHVKTSNNPNPQSVIAHCDVCELKLTPWEHRQAKPPTQAHSEPHPTPMVLLAPLASLLHCAPSPLSLQLSRGEAAFQCATLVISIITEQQECARISLGIGSGSILSLGTGCQPVQ